MPRRRPQDPPANPFRVGGLVRDAFFTDREAELTRIERFLREPQAKLLVYGRRRMGKTSTLLRALDHHGNQGGVAFRADLSGATTLNDVANRVLQAAHGVLQRRWTDTVVDFLRQLSVSVTMTVDPQTGLAMPSLTVEQRSTSLEGQRANLARVLTAVERVAHAKQQPIGVVLDEFQEIHRFGGTAAEWHFRSIIEQHQHTAYIAVGSQETLIRAMLGKGRAFYKLFEHLHFGPIDPTHLATWIDQQLSHAGVAAAAIGEDIVRVAGPRTRDIVQLARSVFESAAPVGQVAPTTLEDAMLRVVAEESEQIRIEWDALPPSQQNVLRAIAAGETKLHGKLARARFGLAGTADVAQALTYLAKRDLIVREGARVAFDSPFVEAWVRFYALPDAGIPPRVLPVAPEGVYGSSASR